MSVGRAHSSHTGPRECILQTAQRLKNGSEGQERKMETSYRLLWQTKYRELLRDGERERMANALRTRPRRSFGARTWSAIGVGMVVLAVLLQVA